MLQRSTDDCNYTTYSLPSLPSDPHMPKLNTTATQCEDGTGKANWETVSDLLVKDLLITLSSTNITIIRLYSLGITSSKDVKEGLPWDTVAHECSISFCIKGYTGFVSDGSANMSRKEEIGHEAQFITNRTSNGVWKFVNVPTSLNMAEPNSITVEENFRSMLSRLAESVFTGSVSMRAVVSSNGSSDFIWDDTSYQTAVLHYDSGNLKDFTAMIGKVSDDMTNYIRTTSYEIPNSLYAPTVTVLVPVVVVRWPWLTYVLVLQFSGLLFLFLTIQATNRRRIRAWKGHRMALLLAELDSGLQRKAQGGLSHRSGLDDRIGETKVRLEFDGDDRIAFRCVDQELRHRRTVGLEFRSASEAITYRGV